MRITSLRLKGVGPFEDTTIEFPQGTNPDLADVYLLVGKNGCGKTTALQALASVLAPPTRVAERLLEDRFRGESANVVAASGLEGNKSLSWGAIFERGRALADVAADGAKYGLEVGAGGTQRTYFFKPAGRSPWDVWWEHFAGGTEKLAWAVFAYSGTRRAAPVRVNSIQELPPLAHLPISFAESGDTQRLAQWAANQKYRRLQARDEGNAAIEAAATESLARVERAITEVIGNEFAFSFSLQDLNVRARVGDVTTDIDLLPEGLKSIVSWLGDLLMNLDLIEWKTPGPVNAREFLLLLDEVDVHLHPEWQRRILPVVQRTFPKAQVIATTHSPFVVASLKDGAVIELALDEKGNSVARKPVQAPFFKSYSETMTTLFGIGSDFDLDTEAELRRFHEAGQTLQPDDEAAWRQYESLGASLAARSEDLSRLVRFELNQTRRQRGLTGS